MGRKPSEENERKRMKAKQLFMDSDGSITPAEIAGAMMKAGEEVKPEQIRKWKCMDKWQEELDNRPRKKGGQKGNQNAKGHGAPMGNRNAEKHGAYSTVRMDELSEEDNALLASVTLDPAENMLRELKILLAKERDLISRIERYKSNDNETMYADKVVEMRTPSKEEETDVYGSYSGESGSSKTLELAMETTVKSSGFNRSVVLETELNKVQGRIIKLIDTMKSYELEKSRLSLEEKRYELMKQRITGVYDVDPETGEINDTIIDADIKGEAIIMQEIEGPTEKPDR